MNTIYSDQMRMNVKDNFAIFGMRLFRKNRTKRRPIGGRTAFKLPAQACVQLHLPSAGSALQFSEKAIVDTRHQSVEVGVVEEVEGLQTDAEPGVLSH